MKKKLPIILLNFSDVYDYESFASSQEIVHVDCRELNGVDCYCDEDGRKELRQLLAPYPAKALHFIDSGDYHYLTEYWVSKLQEPFSLIVLDHHPDMQQPQWTGVVSCGGWVTDVLEKNSFVRNIIIVGASDELISQVPAHRCSVPFLYKALRILNQCDVNYRQSSNKRLLAEITLIEVAQITQPDDAAGVGPGPKRLKSLFRLITASQPKAAAQVAVAEPPVRRPQKEVQTVEAVAPSEAPKTSSRAAQPMVNPLLGMSSLSFSSILKNEEKVAQIEDDAFKTDADSAQPEGKPFDDAQLGLEWRGMCNRMPKKYIALAQRMKNIDPVITDYPLVEAVADNTFLANEIIEIKPRIEKTLQIALGCPDLKLSVRVAEAKEIKRMPTRREMLDHLRANHHAVGKLIDNLQLLLT